MSTLRLTARLALAGLVRNPGRTAVRVGVVAASVALLAGMLLFIASSLRTASASAVRSVPLDWQGPTASYAKDKSAAKAVASQAGIAAALPAATAPFSGATHVGVAGHTATGSGSLLAVPPHYSLQTFRLLQGSLRPGKIVLDQQMAATL
ncbi:MAG: hypothetical protein QOJ01_828, partial [Solirubrobacterales bacterium]|nr:hypothetical protein [Solirubrobacterales bacterium]